MKATYERPVEGELHVHLANGESWAATDEDLVRFRLCTQYEAYRRFSQVLAELLRGAELIGRDLTDAQLNPIRHLAEVAITMPELMDRADRDWTDVVDLERRLLATHLEDTDVEDALGALDIELPDDAARQLALYLNERLASRGPVTAS